MSVIKVSESDVFGGLHVGQSRPLVQKIQSHGNGQIFAHQVQGLWKVVLERALQLVSQKAAAVHCEGAGMQNWVGVVIAIAVVLQDEQQHKRVGRVVLGAGRTEGTALARAGRRMDRIDSHPGSLQ